MFIYRAKVLFTLFSNIRKINFSIRTITLKDNSVFYYRNFMDIWTIAEVYILNDYANIGLVIKNTDTVIDIGGSIGEFSILASRFAKKVVVFEPIKYSCDILLKNLQVNKINNVKLYNCAIGNSELKINIKESNFGNSTTGETEGVIVETLKLNEALKLSKSEKAILKIDCEGAEYDIILNTPKPVLNKFSQIAMEWHEFESGQNYEDLVKRLIECGFAVKYFPNPVHKNIGFIYAKKAL